MTSQSGQQCKGAVRRPRSGSYGHRVLTWSTIAYGAAISAVLAGLVAFGLSRRAGVAMAAFVAAAAGPFGWNAVLRAAHAREFFTDAPIAALPARDRKSVV